jgi:hypothetical protein
MRLLEAGIDRFLHVERENMPARRFYEFRGFAVARGCAKSFFGHEKHGVEMVLEVKKPAR